MCIYCTMLPIDFFFFLAFRQFYLHRELQGRYLHRPIKGSYSCSRYSTVSQAHLSRWISCLQRKHETCGRVDPRRGSELVAVIGATGEALQKKRRRNDETVAGERLEEPCSYFYYTTPRWGKLLLSRLKVVYSCLCMVDLIIIFLNCMAKYNTICLRGLYILSRSNTLDPETLELCVGENWEIQPMSLTKSLAKLICICTYTIWGCKYPRWKDWGACRRWGRLSYFPLSDMLWKTDGFVDGWQGGEFR